MSWGALALGALNLIGGERARRQSERFASNRHQIEVADLRAAGINPLFTASGGSGAPMPMVTNTIGEGLSAGLTAMVNYSQSASLDASTALTKLTTSSAQPIADVMHAIGKFTGGFRSWINQNPEAIDYGVKTVMNKLVEVSRSATGSWIPKAYEVLESFVKEVTSSVDRSTESGRRIIEYVQEKATDVRRALTGDERVQLPDIILNTDERVAP